jgi:hypothetical protein
MPLRSRRSTVLVTAGVALTLAACSSSTTPKPPTPQQLASHFDSIYSALNAAQTGEDSTIAEIIALTAVAPPAYGSAQSSFTVTTGSGAATWKGYTLELASTGDGGDSSFITAAFSDNNLSQLVFAENDYNACGPEGGSAIALVGLSKGSDDLTYTGSAGLASVGNSCPALQSGLASGPLIADFSNGASCEQATFNVSIAATFPDSLGALSTVSISNATFDGVRLSGTEVGTIHVAPVPSRVAALGLRLRALHMARTAR